MNKVSSCLLKIHICARKLFGFGSEANRTLVNRKLAYRASSSAHICIVQVL